MKYKKIYIIGPVSSGKTTMSKVLARKYNIKSYELDKIVWDDITHKKRKEAEIIKDFEVILKKQSWIIEDVGRATFTKGISEADIVYYLYLNKVYLYYKVLKRWIKQKLKLEESNYKQDIKTLIMNFKWLNNDLKTRDDKIKNLQKLNNNVVIINKKQQNLP